MAKTTYREVLQWASSFLEKQGKEGYSIQYIFLARKKWQKLDWLLHMNEEISLADQQMVQEDLAQLLQDVPAQYLIGYAEFYGQQFKVTSATLIPRPETEELVQWCLQAVEEPVISLVDVGTGTGAIAITLKKAKPNWLVSATDISADALTIARENGQELKAQIQYYQGDTLQPVLEKKFDVIISNPPYIATSEWSVMDESVRKFEPKMALFAEDNGLAIYKKIAQQAKTCLTDKGNIFLEIGYQQADDVTQIFKEAFPDKTIDVRKDLSGLDRMVRIHS